MHNPMRFLFALALLSIATTSHAGGKIELRDYCDPADPAWIPSGGCVLEDGDVTLVEFNALLTSMFSSAVVGHPAWRLEPSFVEIDAGDKLRVMNTGGRVHTFTEVAQFGGGRVPPLSIGLNPAPECANAVNIAAGARVDLRGLSPGNHLFQCCIHPWMRALVNVEGDGD